MVTEGYSYCGQISDQRETSTVIKWFIYTFRINNWRGAFTHASVITPYTPIALARLMST